MSPAFRYLGCTPHRSKHHERHTADAHSARTARSKVAAGVGHARSAHGLGDLRGGLCAGAGNARLRDEQVLHASLFRWTGAATLQTARSPAAFAAAWLPYMQQTEHTWRARRGLFPGADR